MAGIRGTEPSWDEEMAAKYGFWEHWEFQSRMLRARLRRHEEQRRLRLAELLESLQDLLKERASKEGS